MRFYWRRWWSFCRWWQAYWGHSPRDITWRPLMVGVQWSHKDWEVARAITCRHGIEICCLRFKKKKKNEKGENEINMIQ